MHKHYLIPNCISRKQKNAHKYPYPRPPTSNNDMTLFNSLEGITWSKANVADFWAAGLACVQTLHTSTGRLGWIQGDQDQIWYHALDHAALTLIRQYAVMAVNMTDEEIFRVPVKDLLRSVPTFRFEEMSPAIKSVLVIVEDCPNLFAANLAVHEYYDEATAIMPSSPDSTSSSESTPEPDARACDEFVSTATKNEGAYVARAEQEDQEYHHELARDTVVLMRDQEYPPTAYRLDTLRPPPLKPDVADAIGLRYGRIPLKAKTMFHIDQMHVEIRRLNILIAQGCRRVSALESEVKYIETLEAQRLEQIRILKSVKEQDVKISRKIKSRKAAVEEPLPIKQPAASPEFGPDGDFEETLPSKAPETGQSTSMGQTQTSGISNCPNTPGRPPALLVLLSRAMHCLPLPVRSLQTHKQMRCILNL